MADSNLSSVNKTSLSSFNSNHSLYESARPGYQKHVVDFVLQLRQGKEILEIAAGTGKFTAELLKRVEASHVTALEPSEGMLKSFKEKFPNVKTIQAASDKIPLEDNTVDTIYIAQAFHWFANRESLAEFRRVLKPSGVLVLLWNYEDFSRLDKEGWQAKTTNLVHSYDGDVPQYRRMDWEEAFKSSQDLFGDLKSRKFIFELEIPSREAYWDYWASRSYITALDESERLQLKEKILKILDETEGDLKAKRGTHVVWTYPVKDDSDSI